MSSGSVSLGRYAGIPVRAHWSMTFIAAFFGWNLGMEYGIILGAIATVAFFGSILAHEFGHALVARRYGVQTESIDLWALGGVARLDREPPSPRADGLIAVAGPAVSLVLGIAAFGLGWALGSGVLAMIGLINLLLGIFNMFPGAPLDGGRLVRAVRWAQTGNKYRAMRDAGHAGRVLGWAIAGIGLILMVNGFSGSILFVLTGAFIALNARAEIMASYLGEQLDGVKVRDLTWFGIAQAGTDMDADSMIWQRQRLGSAGAVAVLDDDGKLDGLVMEEQLWAIPSDRRAMVMLTQLMVPMSKVAKASPDEDLASVLPRLNPLRPVLTVWNDEKLLGIIPPKRLKERLERAQRAVLPGNASI